MPAVRCSNCGRSMDAVAKCNNPRCSIPEYVLNYDNRFWKQIIPDITQRKESGPSNSSVVEMIDGSTSTVDSAISENDNLTARLEAQNVLRGKVVDLSSRLSDALSELEAFNEESHRQYSNTSNELKDSVSMVTSEQKKLAEKHAILVSEQVKLKIDQENLNQVFTEKVSALESLRDEVNRLGSELEDQSTSNTDAIANLGYASNEKYRQLEMANGKFKEMLAQIVSDQKNLSAKNYELVNYLTELRHEKEVSHQYFTIRLGALENFEKKFDQLLDKFDRQLDIDETAAATFHTMAFDKYKLLDSICVELQTSLDRISSDQKQLGEETTRLVSEQAELQKRVDKVEEEQSECSCNELRMMMIQKEKKNNSPVNARRELWCKLETMEKELEEQKSVVCGLPKNQEQNFVELIRAIAIVMNLELRPSDDENFNNGITGENLLTSGQGLSKQLLKALVLKRQVKNDESLSEVNPRPVYNMIATFALLTNLILFSLFGYILRQVFDQN